MDVTNTDEHNNERNSLLPKAKMIRSKTDFFLIVALQGLYLASFGMYSVIGPFYMLKAKEKGTTATVSGLVICSICFCYICLITSSWKVPTKTWTSSCITCRIAC